MSCALTPGALAVSLHAHAPLAPELDAYARARLVTIARDARVEVRSASLELHGDVAGPAATHAIARLHMGDGVARAHVAGATTQEAIDRATSRLRRQVAAMREVPLIAPRRPGALGPWEFGSEPADRPAYAARAVRDRAIVRRKAYDRTLRQPETAVARAALLDYDFYLFVDAHTRRPAVVRRTDPCTWRLADAIPCRVDDAVELLNVTNARFVFFVDDSTSGLHALYRRFDGNYGLIAPAE